MKPVVLFLVLGALAVSSPAVLAQCNNGYDQFQTGSGTSFNLPGIGTVNFQGVPINSSAYGNADTIILRTPSGTNGVCNIQVWALFMKSTSPITFNGQSADVYGTINNTGGTVPTSVLPQPDTLYSGGSSGTLTIESSGPSGGTFNSSLNVYADLIFVKTGTSVTNSANWLGHQALTQSQGKTLVGISVQWFTNPQSNYPACLSADVFYVYQIAGQSHPHPVLAATIQCSGGVGAATHKPGTTAGSGQIGMPMPCACAIAQ